MKQLIKKHTPPFILFLKEALPVYMRDLKRFYKFSAINGYHNEQNKLAGKIIERYHSIEKGLTMPNPRLGFGQQQLMDLTKDCIHHIKKFGIDSEQLQHAVGVIYEYENKHLEAKFALNEGLQKSFLDLKSVVSIDIEVDEQKVITKEEYFRDFNSSFPIFSGSRRSIRNWGKEDVSQQKLLEVIKLAQNAPSACNRQTAKAYIYVEAQRIEQLLLVQGGNRGFGHLANKLIIITADLGVFGFLSERNQGYIDGGIFAMNVLYSLHYHQIAACILNCAMSVENETKVRVISENIKDSEVIIAMIACGVPPAEFSVAVSRRYPLKEMCFVSNSEKSSL